MAIPFTIASLIRMHRFAYSIVLVSIAIFTQLFANCFAFVSHLDYHCDKMCVSATTIGYQRTICNLHKLFNIIIKYS